jgi:hypothetical protein
LLAEVGVVDSGWPRRRERTVGFVVDHVEGRIVFGQMRDRGTLVVEFLPFWRGVQSFLGGGDSVDFEVEDVICSPTVF